MYLLGYVYISLKLSHTSKQLILNQTLAYLLKAKYYPSKLYLDNVPNRVQVFVIHSTIVTIW